MEWKNTNKTLQILKAAEEGGYGIIATVVYTLDQVTSTIKAAENKNSPVMVLMFPWAIKNSNGALVRAAADCARRAKVPVAVHLDHAQTPEEVKAAVELPFDSIMVDMSHYEKEENLRLTAEMVKLCNSHEISTEAEPGRIEGTEDGVMDTATLEGLLTTPEDAVEFIDTGVDMLAPSFGNFHGNYPPEGPQLRLDLLKQLAEVCKARDVRLVLHGTNDFTEELLKENIKLGVTKLNVNRLVLDKHFEYFEKNADKVGLTELIEVSNDLIVQRTEHWMDVCGSSGRA
ncbi:unnamed protein product [Kuraishia capsulata CBS 1993]|uniref:Fructose-bisphosphate aldolase n=1 Tax=Kuraishia capsulata CBS 1993 TaxID=1382522 RepID=W6MPY2_9ASCO|nr:uncharacterized protein KUCA_T00004769001 [Kuraishia capsulata CBS 1993]CDK28784.1 unnamed protein product [Kuraishia capsulata CBS 1993]